MYNIPNFYSISPTLST